MGKLWRRRGAFIYGGGGGGGGGGGDLIYGQFQNNLKGYGVEEKIQPHA